MNKFITYSTNFEDLILNRIFAGQPHGFYVDVGAEHPILGNDTYGLYLRGWRGVNFEPNVNRHKQLLDQRPHDTNICLALDSAIKDSLMFHEIVETGLSTFNETYAKNQAAAGRTVKMYSVPTSTLAIELANLNVPKIDVLKVDVEGHEENVLAGNDWRIFRPSLILLEATLPQSRVRQVTNIKKLMETNGYRHVHFDGLNDFYLEQDFEVAEDVFLPPNVFDSVESYDVHNLRRAFADMCAHVGSLEQNLELKTTLHKNKAEEYKRIADDFTHHTEKQKDYISRQDEKIRHLLVRVGQLETLAVRQELPSAPSQTALELEVFKIAVAATLVVRRQILERGQLVSKKQKPLDYIKRSLLFDANWYFERYPDVKAAKVNAEDHYLASGAQEGRDPGPLFNTFFYIKHNPHILRMQINPLVHFEMEGYKALVP